MAGSGAGPEIWGTTLDTVTAISLDGQSASTKLLKTKDDVHFMVTVLHADSTMMQKCAKHVVDHSESQESKESAESDESQEVELEVE